ncbi:MAG: hypothetical protein GX029_05885 [Pseudomonadaceae bacterium]|nr:hypothetical protein [Pseudomonadaceae bacterium]
MSKKDNKDRRLEELAKQWELEATPTYFDKFTAGDLQLMLQHFQPLQQLIQAIAQGQAISSPVPAEQDAIALPAVNDLEVLEHQVISLEKALALSQEENKQLQEQAEKDKEKLKQAAETIQSQTEHLEALQQKLSSLTAKHQQQEAQLTKSLTTANAQLEQADKKLQEQQKKSSQLSQQLAEMQAQLHENQLPAELAFLRNEPELMQSLGLALPENDQQALIAMVAVLAQKDNLERLWDNLKDKCEKQKRPATSEENNLLNAALAWYNHNWKTRPFQLLKPATPSSYDFEKQQKTKHQTDGETVSQVWLTGIADGAGKPLRKTLVLTQ